MTDPGDDERGRSDRRTGGKPASRPETGAAADGRDASVGSSAFDPDAPLPGPPEPWQPSTMPPVRAAPPWRMTEMIAAEPAFAERLLARLPEDDSFAGLVAAVRLAADDGDPIVLTGCGTSEHAALGAAAILRAALASGDSAGDAAHAPTGTAYIEAVQAFEHALAPRGGLCIAISHEGGTWATNRALTAARSAGARTVLITVGTGSPAAALADVVVTTREQDQSWCHTIGYVAPLLVAAAAGAALRGDSIDPVAMRGVIAAGHDGGTTAAVEAVASALGGADRLLVVGSGADRTSARELALKLEEGAHLPADARDLETLLHGHLAAAYARTGIVLLLLDARERADRVARALEALAATREIGQPAAAIVAASAADRLEAALTTAGRIVVADAPALPAPVAALLGAAVPLQLLTERLARVRSVNPDTLRRTEAPWSRAGERYR